MSRQSWPRMLAFRHSDGYKREAAAALPQRCNWPPAVRCRFVHLDVSLHIQRQHRSSSLLPCDQTISYRGTARPFVA